MGWAPDNNPDLARATLARARGAGGVALEEGRSGASVVVHGYGVVGSAALLFVGRYRRYEDRDRWASSGLLSVIKLTRRLQEYQTGPLRLPA